MLCTRVLHCVCVYVAASVLAPYTTLVNCQLPKDTRYKIRNHAFLIIVYNHPTSLHQFFLAYERRTKNVTKSSLYAYIWDPLRLVKIGYGYIN